MPIVMVPDLDDPRLAVFRQVKLTNVTRGLDLFVLEGQKLVLRVLESRFETVSVLATDRALERVAPHVPPEIPVLVVAHAHVSELVGYTFHMGVLAAARRKPWPGLSAILEGGGHEQTLVVCPHVDNPENLGAIVRIADVFGASCVVAGPKCPDPLSRRVLRVSMGTSLRVPVLPFDDLNPAIAALHSAGVSLVATVVHDPAAEPLERFARPSRLGLVLGNESHGLDPFWVERCERRITIPMRQGAESLNVAVAAGILLHHLTGAGRWPGGVTPTASGGYE